jgi:predicted lipoprotein with Yx(FWY)xxD motif
VARTLRVLTVLAGLAVLTGCGADRDAVPARIEPAAAPPPRAQPVALDVAEIRGLGRVLTDQSGRTLYLFTQDSKTPSLSTCLGECARKWPPLLATGDVVVTGVEQNMVGTLARPDGRTQVTVGGWPVYTYAQDTAPGQANGHGALTTWYAITPEGTKAGVPARVAVKATEIDGFGPVLTDQDGRTLYLFTQDSAKPPQSTCDGECAANWPPLLATGKVTVTGVDRDLVGQVRRPDNASQVTVGGWPVYTFTKDTAPGQTTGHGASGVWFVIEPEGCRSRAPVSQQPTPEGPDGSTGY